MTSAQTLKPQLQAEKEKHHGSLAYAIRKGDLVSLEWWVEHYPEEVNTVDRSGQDLVGLAIMKQEWDCAHRLIPLQKNLNADSGPIGYSALHWAVNMDRSDLVQKLVEHGADPHQVAKKLQTNALYIAAFRESEALTRYLLDLGVRFTPPKIVPAQMDQPTLDRLKNIMLALDERSALQQITAPIVTVSTTNPSAKTILKSL